MYVASYLLYKCHPSIHMQGRVYKTSGYNSGHKIIIMHTRSLEEHRKVSTTIVTKFVYVVSMTGGKNEVPFTQNIIVIVDCHYN